GPGEETGGRAQGAALDHACTGRRDAARAPQYGRLWDRRIGDVLGESEILAGERGAPGLASFGVLLAGYGLIAGLAGRSAALGIARYGRRPLLAAVGVL